MSNSSSATLVCAVLALLLGVGCSRPPASEREDAAQPRSPIRVTVVTPERRTVSRNLSLTATVEPYEQAALYAKVSGYIKSLSADIGDRVTKGQVLATLEVPEVQQQYVQASATLGERRAQLRKAEAEAKLAETISVRSKALRAKDAITQQEMEEASAQYETAEAGVEVARSEEQSAEARLSELRDLVAYAQITAPFDGIVTRRFVDRGALMQAATSNNNITPVITVARIDLVRVFVDVPEPSAPYVHRGVPATLEVGALPGQSFKGSVTRYADALDPATRTMRTEVDLANADAALRPGMYGNLAIALQDRADALSLPRSVVHRDDLGAFIYVLRDGRAVERRVGLGLESDQRVEIVDGVTDGIRVISATQELQHGTPVMVAAHGDRRELAGHR
jgi:RND family efflux transporter MFP subunit